MLNHAAGLTRAEALLVIGSDIRLAPGALSRALARLRSTADAAAVGGMILRSNGRLRAAGGFHDHEGVPGYHLDGAPPETPEARFRRDVDFCPADFLLLDRELLLRIGGFDATLPLDRAAAALGGQIRKAGCRVIFDPKIRVESPGRAGADAMPPAPSTAALRQRVALPVAKRRILVIEDRIPLRHTGAGYGRMNDIIRCMAGMDLAVTVLGMMPPLADPAEIEADFPDTVEILYDRSAEDLPALLAARPGAFDTLWICRSPNLGQVHGLPALQAIPRRIFDTEAIAATREAQIAALEGRPFDLPARLAEEFACAGFASRVLAVSKPEAALLRGLGLPSVATLGHQAIPRQAPGPGGRKGLLFLGALHDMASPNFDSLTWFLDQVFPALLRETGGEITLTIAGYVSALVDTAGLERHPNIRLAGPVSDLAPLFDSHRVFVAPTRIAAGIPHKLHEAAAQGLPAVASRLLRDQLGWSAAEMLAAPTGDARSFARKVLRLDRDDTLWSGLQSGMQKRLREENAPGPYRAQIARILDLP